MTECGDTTIKHKNNLVKRMGKIYREKDSKGLGQKTIK